MSQNTTSEINKTNKELDKTIISISLVLVFVIVGFLYFMPDQSQKAANSIFSVLTDIFGSPVLLLTFIGTFTLAGVAISKYGSVRLGEGKPEYSTFRWISMMMSCGLGSATVYWAFIEWAYYIGTPGLGIEPHSLQAFEMSVPYTMFHWGPHVWSYYAIVGLPIAYHFHVRKNKGLSLSSVISAITGLRPDGFVCRIIDVLFIFICFGALSITLGVSTPLVTQVLCSVIGIEPTFMINLFIIIILSILYSLSSYIGLKKGMARISDWNVKLMIGFIAFIAILGPTAFIIKNFVNSIGLMVHNFVPMSLFTDPITQGGFPESWTIFFWLYTMTYAPFTGIFIAKISRGRSVRSVIANTLISGPIGTLFFFGVLGSLSLDRTRTGVVDVIGMLDAGQANLAIVELLRSVPPGAILMVIFSISTILFLATTLDGSAFTMAATTTKGLKNDEEPSPFLRLFWCIMLSLVPLTMILIDADLNTIKTCAIVVAVPLIFIMITMLVGWIRWLKADYGAMSAQKIEDESESKANM